MKNIDGKCPHCNNPIQVDVEKGVISKKTQKTGDVFNAALKKIADDKKLRKTQFENAQKDLSKKKKESDDLFKKGLGDIKKDGLGDKPVRDIDL